MENWSEQVVIRIFDGLNPDIIRRIKKIFDSVWWILGHIEVTYYFDLINFSDSNLKNVSRFISNDDWHLKDDRVIL